MATKDYAEADSTTITHLLEECRMVLPGIQALFGFQLIAIFSQGFRTELTGFEQRLHLLAVVLVVIAVAFVMAPAAYHRQAHHVTRAEQFVSLSSRLLLLSMFPLMAAICIDFYVIARIILLNRTESLLGSIFLLVIYVCLWFLLPRSRILARWLTS